MVKLNHTQPTISTQLVLGQNLGAALSNPWGNHERYKDMLLDYNFNIFHYHKELRCTQASHTFISESKAGHLREVLEIFHTDNACGL